MVTNNPLVLFKLLAVFYKGYRSLRRDLELQVAMITHNRALQLALNKVSILSLLKNKRMWATCCFLYRLLIILQALNLPLYHNNHICTVVHIHTHIVFVLGHRTNYYDILF